MTAINQDQIGTPPKRYSLRVKETGNKSGKYIYEVIDETGAVITTKRSNRQYVACTINGQYYFGRIDLIGKGDHGADIKFYSRPYMSLPDYLRARYSAEGIAKILSNLNTIAYLS